jgi:hypothetical protein
MSEVEKVSGYLFVFSTGEYSSRCEYVYIFPKMPDIKLMTAKIQDAWDNDAGHFRGKMPKKMRDIIEELGGSLAPIAGEAWADDYGTSEASLLVPSAGIDQRWGIKDDVDRSEEN